jgi:hypothetical protein
MLCAFAIAANAEYHLGDSVTGKKIFTDSGTKNIVIGMLVNQSVDLVSDALDRAFYGPVLSSNEVYAAGYHYVDSNTLARAEIIKKELAVEPTHIIYIQKTFTLKSGKSYMKVEKFKFADNSSYQMLLDRYLDNGWVEIKREEIKKEDPEETTETAE